MCFLNSILMRALLNLRLPMKLLLRGDVGVDGLYKFNNVHLLKKPSAPSGLSSVVD